MKEDTQKLDEVVVIGYGTQKKMNLTGSVATISAENIATIPVSNISNAMAGRMPGIFSYNKSGMPGVSSPITIRGVNTPNNTNPTYVSMVSFVKKPTSMRWIRIQSKTSPY